jgi:cytochrome c-type biogenesis protein CcmH
MKALFAAALLACALTRGNLASAQEQSHGPDQEQAADEFHGYVPGADRLEGRLLAPCCWNQTLDVHSSDIATALKHEIRQRLHRGESADAIETDFVARYGERILAVPKHSPLKDLAVVLSASMGLAGAGAAFMIVRWRRRAKPLDLGPRPPSSKSAAEGDDLDERLDRELANQPD